MQQQGFTPQQVAGFTSGPATYSPEVINEVMGLTPGQDQAFLGGQARAALIAAGNRVNEISRYQVEFKIEISGQPTQVGFINVDGENTHMQFAELELISVDGVTYINVGGSWQELPTAAGAGAVANSPFSPQTVTSNLEDLEALNASGVEIVDAGTVDVPGGTCHAYTMTIDSEPGNATFCLDEDSGILRQMVITEAATNTTVTMTFSYEDMAVTAP